MRGGIESRVHLGTAGRGLETRLQHRSDTSLRYRTPRQDYSWVLLQCNSGKVPRPEVKQSLWTNEWRVHRWM